MYGIPTLVSSQSAIGKFLLQLNCPEKTKALVNLTGNVDNDKEIWTQKIRNAIPGKESNPTQWVTQIRKDIKKSFQAWSKSILVLLHKFSQAQESCLAFQLCQKLVKEGHHLIVSTTASGEELESELQQAKRLTDDSPGSITLLEPKYGEQEKPSVEWIELPDSQYFLHLSQLQNIQMIIGNLPGTSQTAVALKERLKCKLILLATTKLGSGNDVLKQTICKLARNADEIWSVGPDTYSHYNDILSDKSIGFQEKHRMILFQPLTNHIPFWEQNKEGHKIRRRLVSSWSKPVHFYLEGQDLSSKGSDIESFSTLSAALRNVLQPDVMRHKTEKWHWDIHGFEPNNPRFNYVDDTVDITPLNEVTSPDLIDWDNCMAFIVPDYEEETFNHLALTAIWLGIPTVASKQSSIGKFLLSLSSSCSIASRAVVHLKGNVEQDTEAWTNKIKDILDRDARPTEWARQLARYLRSSNDLWEPNLPTLKNNRKRGLPSNLNASLFTKKNGQISRSDVLNQVAKHLERSNISDLESKFSGRSSIESQVSYSISLKT